MVKLSFIVPVYNVEKYLRKCVNSLIHQDFTGYEVILVDDGSTDNSGKICDELSESISEERLAIRVIHQANAGLSAARNAGLKVAKGEYVCFVDSDDYWEENVLGGLMAQVERENLDVLRYDYQNVRIKNEGVNELKSEGIYEVFEPNKTPRYIDKCNEVVDGETYLNERMSYACYAVMFIIRRNLIIGDRRLEIGDCLFTEGIHFEDVDWLPRMMLRARRVNSTAQTVYSYLVRQGSITKTQGDIDKIRKNVEDELTIIARYNHLISQYSSCKWLRNMRSSMAAGVIANVAQYLYPERKANLARLKEMNVYPLTLANQGKTYLRRARLINISPRLIVELLHVMNTVR